MKEREKRERREGKRKSHRNGKMFTVTRNVKCYFQTFVGTELPNGEHLPEDCTFISKSETVEGGIKEVTHINIHYQHY